MPQQTRPLERRQQVRLQQTTRVFSAAQLQQTKQQAVVLQLEMSALLQKALILLQLPAALRLSNGINRSQTLC